MADYPSTLPLPDYGTYAGVVDNGLLQTTVLTAQRNQLITYNSPTTKLSMTFSMDNDIYALWFSWVKTNAYYWFNMPVVSTNQPTDITSTRQVRFISDLSYTKREDNWLSVNVTAELIPGEPP